MNPQERPVPLTVLVIGGLGLLDILAAALMAWAPFMQGWGFGQAITVGPWHTTVGRFCGTFLAICGVVLVAYAAWMRRRFLAPSGD